MENVKRSIKEDTDRIKEDAKDVKVGVNSIKESMMMVSILGELYLVGSCFTLNVLINPGCQKKFKEIF